MTEGTPAIVMVKGWVHESSGTEHREQRALVRDHFVESRNSGGMCLLSPMNSHERVLAAVES
jgi:hypothetical protein